MITDTFTSEELPRSSVEIESDIRETRDRMDSTLDELGHRLTARSLLNSALDWWDAPVQGNQGSAAARRAAMGLARQARQHPMPALLIGSGIAWLIAEMRDRDERMAIRQARGDGFPQQDAEDTGLGGKVGQKVTQLKESAAGAVGVVREKTSELGDKAHEVRDRFEHEAHERIERSRQLARRVKEELKEGYRSGADRFERACDEYPLAVGVGFAALGALVGLVIPRTKKEDELMGQRSDQLVDDTREAAKEMVEAGKHIGERVMEAAKEEARHQGLTPGGVSETISELAARGGRVVQAAKDEATQATEEEGLKPPGSQGTMGSA